MVTGTWWIDNLINLQLTGKPLQQRTGFSEMPAEPRMTSIEPRMTSAHSMNIDTRLSWFPVTVMKYPLKNKLEEKQFQVTVLHEGRSRPGELEAAGHITTQAWREKECMLACAQAVSFTLTQSYISAYGWLHPQQEACSTSIVQ